MRNLIRFYHRKQDLLSIVLFSCVLAILFSGTISAKRYDIDPAVQPAITLSPAEANQLKDLLSAKRVIMESEVSPDDHSILISLYRTERLFFKALNTGENTPVDPSIFDFSFLTEFRWVSAEKLVVYAMAKDKEIKRLTICRNTGSYEVSSMSNIGAVLSLSKKGKKLLVAREDGMDETRSAQSTREQIIEMRPKHKGFDSDESDNVPVTRKKLKLFAIDTKCGKEHFLTDIAADIAIMSTSWSHEGNRIALVRGKIPSFARGGVITMESPEVIDALGNYPPEENPFVLTNALEIFKIEGDTVSQETVPADPEEHEVFASVEWSPFGNHLMVQMAEASFLSGREYPTYCNTNASNFKFFDLEGECFHTLNRKEVNAKRSLSFLFLSPFEVLISVPEELSFRIYYYHLKTQTLKCLPTPDGQISQINRFNKKKKIIFGFNSFTQPFELFTMEKGCDTIKKVTVVNEKAAHANKVRVDKLSFTLSSGNKREGYLIQPQCAPFPPKDVRICVWQNGGPTATMTNHWSGNIENGHNLLPNFGIATLMVPLPGRIGFGKAFLNGLADDLNFGQIDIDEQMEISRTLIEKKMTSKEKIGIYGMSYGGYFTSQTITTYPDFYAAANNQFSLINLFDEWKTGYMGYLTYLMGCTPENNYDEYFKDSPLQRAKNVKIPTLVYTSSHDFLPAKFSVEFHDEINKTGNAPSDVYYFENEGHGLYHPNNQFVAGQAQIEWFRKYLAP